MLDQYVERFALRIAADVWDESTLALLDALEIFEGRDAAFEAKHPRNLKGTPGGGKFRSLAARIAKALEEWADGKGNDNPFEEFDKLQPDAVKRREQFRKVAKERGIPLKRGASEIEIKNAILEDVRKNKGGKSDTPEPEAKPQPKPPEPKPAKKAPAKKATTPKAPEPSTAEPVKRGPDSPKAKALRKRLDELNAEAAPIVDDWMKQLESSRVPTHNENMEFYKRQARLKKLREEGSEAAKELLGELIDQEGVPFGGDSDADADRWREAGLGAAGFDFVGGGNPDELQKTRDRYVVSDKNTITQNASLRSGDPTPAAKSWAARMSRFVRSSKLKRDTKVYRAAALRPEQVMELQPGAILHDRGIVSTGRERGDAETYLRYRTERQPDAIGVMFEIRAPAGTPAKDVSYGEIVLDRDNRFRVVSSRMGDDGTVHVTMELTDDATNTGGGVPGRTPDVGSGRVPGGTPGAGGTGTSGGSGLGPKRPAAKVRPSGLPTDRPPVAADFKDLAESFTGKSETDILQVLADLKATELKRLASSMGLGRLGIKIPDDLTLDEKRRWLAQKLSAKTFHWRDAKNPALEYLARRIARADPKSWR